MKKTQQAKESNPAIDPEELENLIGKLNRVFEIAQTSIWNTYPADKKRGLSANINKLELDIINQLRECNTILYTQKPKSELEPESETSLKSAKV